MYELVNIHPLLTTIFSLGMTALVPSVEIVMS